MAGLMSALHLAAYGRVTVATKCRMQDCNTKEMGANWSPRFADEGEFQARLLVCNEPHRREKDGIVILPWREFVQMLWAGEIF